ncbi:MAG TPA: alpha/beta hydrolase [Polyangiaceae bacterium]|nr:alpha/beta hydrolase [Polyangiaceae bacterium]
MSTVHVRGIDLYYEACGVGSTCLVVAHGALGSVAHANSYGLRAADLATLGFRVVAYDARGHGRSGYTTRPEHYQPAALADDLLALIDALGLERVCVYGASMGASTALQLALVHPERVSRLVLRAPSPFGVDIKAARARLHPLASMYRWLGSSVTASVAATLTRRADRAATKALLSGQRRQAIPPAIRGFLSAPMDSDGLASVATPSLILTHPDDPLHPLRSGEILRLRLPCAKLLVAPSRSYWDQNREQLMQVVASWLRE